ncbi:MAG: TonB-dependent receptor [Microscillaceae bacterium]|nr:TonB-dependent receptor [Microscillaceae bacterium]
MRRLYSLCLILWATFSGFAQDDYASVQGTIIDEITGDFLIGVSIHIQGSKEVTLTDEKGSFLISNIPPKTITIVISHIGYYTDTLSITLRPRQVYGLLWHTLKEKGIGLEETEIFADVVDENVQAPGPVFTVSAQDIEEKMGAQEFPEILKSSPGVFVNTLGGTFGNTQVSIRGFSSENTAVLINGIPINDPENGRISWFNWGGLNDNTYTLQLQRGLGASKLALNSIGGTINITTKPTEQRKGLRLSYTNANRSWQHQVVLNASTGLMKGDWAITALGATQHGDGYRDGTNVDSWDYFISAYKGLGKNHQLILTAFGTPVSTNQGNPATEASFEIAGDKRFNPAWGIRQGEFLSARKNTYHKPTFILNHHWDIQDNLTLTNAVYYSLGRGGETFINRTFDAQISHPLNPTIDPNASENNFQIPWDVLIAENQANQVDLLTGELSPLQGARSHYILLQSKNDHYWVGAISTLDADLSERINIAGGIDFRWAKSSHYQEIEDLLGGDFWIDQENYQDLAYNNLLDPRNTPKSVGDRVGYDYSSAIIWGSVFTQAQYSYGKLDVLLSASLARTGFQRNGKFLHEDFPENSLGKSSWYAFNNFTFKSGINYRINGQHHVYLNPGFFTRAPFFEDAFLNVQQSNQTQGKLNNEKIFSVELGYGFRGERFMANLNLFYTTLSNLSYHVNLDSETYQSAVYYHLSNLNVLHQGIELDFNWQVTNSLNMNGMLSVGNWFWNDNAQAEVLSDPDLRILNDAQTLYINKLKVGGNAQTLAAFNIQYRNPKFWYMGLGANYYDNFYAQFKPEIRTDPAFDQLEKLSSAITLDTWAGKSWKIGAQMLLVKAGINNITDNQFVIDAQQRIPTLNDPSPSPFVQHYFGRTYFISTIFNIR